MGTISSIIYDTYIYNLIEANIRENIDDFKHQVKQEILNCPKVAYQSFLNIHYYPGNNIIKTRACNNIKDIMFRHTAISSEQIKSKFQQEIKLLDYQIKNSDALTVLLLGEDHNSQNIFLTKMLILTYLSRNILE